MVKQGDIFTRGGLFYQVTRATAKTATIKPIRAEFVGHADPWGWEREYMPVPGEFIDDDQIMGRKASAEGKRLKIHDYSAAKNMPTLILGGRKPLPMGRRTQHFRHLRLRREQCATQGDTPAS